MKLNLPLDKEAERTFYRFWKHTSCLKTFLYPEWVVGAKALPGRQLTTTGMPWSHVPLAPPGVEYPRLQLDRWISFPVQFTEKFQYRGGFLRANILERIRTNVTIHHASIHYSKSVLLFYESIFTLNSGWRCRCLPSCKFKLIQK